VTIGPYQSCGINKRTECKEANTEEKGCENEGKWLDAKFKDAEHVITLSLCMYNQKRYMLIEKSCRW